MAPATLPQALAQAAHRWPQRPGWADDERDVTFAEMAERVDRLATWLMARGIAGGSRIAIDAANSIAWLEAYLAAARVGAVVVGLNPRYKAAELRQMLTDSRVATILTEARIGDADMPELFAGLGVPTVRAVFTLEELADLRADRADPAGLDALGVAPQAPVMIIYTSGTTGTPKGAVLTHASQLASARAQAQHTRMTCKDVLPAALPFNHVGGITCAAMTGLVAGACVVPLPAFSRATVHAAFERHRPTVWAGVPTMHTVLLDDAGFGALDRGRVRLVISGGANADPRLLTRIRDGFPNATVMNLYGASEASGAMVMSPWDSSFQDTVRSVGRPIGDVRVRIVSPAGEELPAGELGEVCVAGDSVIPGYDGLPEATGAALRDGWLHTGDIGELDRDGYLTLRGRSKEMYIQGGYNVYPVEVEHVLLGHPGVALAAGIGVPHPVLGEVGRYYIVRSPGAEVTAAELIERCSEQLADYKVPREVVFRDELPLTPAGKVHKAALAQDAAGPPTGARSA